MKNANVSKAIWIVKAADLASFLRSVKVLVWINSDHDGPVGRNFELVGEFQRKDLPRSRMIFNSWHQKGRQTLPQPLPQARGGRFFIGDLPRAAARRTRLCPGL